MAAILVRQAALPVSLVAFTAAFSLFDSLQAQPYTAVDVRGAEFLPKEDIAATCEAVPGAYDSEDMDILRDCLMSTGEFEDVSVRGEGATLVVEVQELNTRPGRVEVTAAYDSRDGLVAQLHFERYNLFPGVFGSVDLTLGSEYRSLQTRAYAAKAWGDFDFGLDTELTWTDYADQGFVGKRARIEPFMSYDLGHGNRVQLGLGYRRDEMDDVEPTTSALLQKEVGTTSAPYLRFGYRFATLGEGRKGELGFQGASVSIDQYFWGLGSDHRTRETRLDAQSQFGLAEKLSLSLGLRAGMVSASGDGATRAMDRFYIGGADFRGFAPRGLGVKDGNDFVGSNKYFVASLEVKRELDDVLGSTGRIGAFVDVGSAWSLEDNLGGTIDDSRHTRSSVGISLEIDIGNVPVQIYAAKALNSRQGDDLQTLGVSFSTRF